MRLADKTVLTTGAGSGMGRRACPRFQRGGARALRAGRSARAGVRANAICPGPILTPMLESLFPNEEERLKRLNRIPLGRFGRPEDVVNAALYLASDESSWTTGTTFVVDGGITVNYF